MEASNPFLTNKPYLEVTFSRGGEVILRAYIKSKSHFRIDISKEDHLTDLFKKIKNRKHYTTPSHYAISSDNVEENIQHFLDNHASKFNLSVKMIHHNKDLKSKTPTVDVMVKEKYLKPLTIASKVFKL